MSFGWKPYDERYNPHNSVIGSKANAYINAGVQLNWMVSRQIDLIAGVTGTHFSNGNTKFPNAGLNTMGLKVGVIYNFNRPEDALTKPTYYAPVPKFPRHVSYDLTLFGSWRRKGVWVGSGQIASPDAYTVLGFNFAPMYNIGYKFRTGVSLDGVYDASSNVYTIPGNGNECYKPSLHKQLALGISGRTQGDYANLKITTREDLPRPVQKEETRMRIGHGYDVHRLVEGRKLILGGVEIPFEKGLLGHSDADVLAHAVMDAVLGAAALGDIGQHFPDNDPAYAGADSLELARHVARILSEHGYRVENIDATILCQRPKLAPHIPAMRANLAAAFGLPVDAVSVKATTEEHLGFTGEGLGIAAHAVALIETR